MQYFRLLDDINFPNRWHLGGLIGIDGMQFVRPPKLPLNSPLLSRRYAVELQINGAPMDYTTTSFRSVPIVSSKVVQALSGLDGFTVLPASVEGLQQNTSNHILHFWDEADCVDEDLSLFEKFQVDDPIRPDLAGQYSGFFKLIVDPARVGSKHIFRLARSGSEVITSHEVKRRFEAAGLTGAVFECVTPE